MIAGNVPLASLQEFCCPLRQLYGPSRPFLSPDQSHAGDDSADIRNFFKEKATKKSNCFCACRAWASCDSLYSNPISLLVPCVTLRIS